MSEITECGNCCVLQMPEDYRLDPDKFYCDRCYSGCDTPYELDEDELEDGYWEEEPEESESVVASDDVAVQNSYHKKIIRLGSSAWTLKALIKEAKKYKTARDFRLGSPTAYNRARKMKWLQEVLAHIPPESKGHYLKWTFKAVSREAKKFKCREAFMVGGAGAYNRARKMGWLDLVCSHMSASARNRPKKTKAISLEEVQAEASSCLTVQEFKVRKNAAYLQAVKRGWLASVCRHMQPERPVELWTLELILLEARRYPSVPQFKSAARNAFAAASTNNWLGLIDDILPRRASYKGRKWTKQALEVEAAKYNKRSDFRNYAEGAYRAAIAQNILDEICGHMVVGERRIPTKPDL
ncbi:hypothetical protein ACM7NO_26540 [Pseudomonas aeruginosa]